MGAAKDWSRIAGFATVLSATTVVQVLTVAGTAHAEPPEQAPVAPAPPVSGDSAPTPSATPPADLPATVPSALATATVHINGSADLVLEQWDGGAWRDVCHSPCGTSLPTNTGYRIGSPRMQTSMPFVISGRGGEAILDVRPVRTGAFEGGIALVVLGSLAIAGSVVLALVGAVGNSICFSRSPCHDGDGFIIAGLGTAGLGVLNIIIGGYLIGSSKRTKVTQAGVDDVALDSAPRVPSWNTALERVLLPSTPMVVPIFSATF